MQIVDYLAEVTIYQQYLNEEDNTVNCEYVFPMDPTSAINRLLFTIDGEKVIEAQVKEAEAAKVSAANSAVASCAHDTLQCTLLRVSVLALYPAPFAALLLSTT